LSPDGDAADFPGGGRRALATMLAMTLLLAYFFANVEIQIEGPAGWAAALPTWRIEQHWLLDLFWGGRPMTGYHAWIFSFMALVFHFPFALAARWNWRAELRVVACIMIFWITEDLLWFLCNPAYGWRRFAPADVPWHKHWIGALPQDYWVYFAVAGFLLVLSSIGRRRADVAR